MDSEDDISNASGNRNNSGRHVHYDDIDEYLDEAMDSDEDADDIAENHKGTMSSASFSYQRKPLNRQPETIYEDEATSKFQSPIKSRLTVDPSDDSNSVALTHTVSFYRRQQTLNSPSVRQVTYAQPNIINKNTNYDDIDDGDVANKQLQEDLVQQKIKTLTANIMIQNQQIAQASNALNTCASTFEFSGSTESVVAEWKLLVASE